MRLLAAGLILLSVALASLDAEGGSGADPMRGRWLDLWVRLQERGAHGDEAQVYSDLAARYCEPHRAYHTLVHVAHALDELEGVRDLAEDSDAIAFALWFHDVVYDIGARDNEEESARIASEAALEFGLPEEWANHISALILETRHGATPLELDAQLVIDIDLSILGQPRERFDAYEQEIRIEYVTVIEERGAAGFNAGRADILRRFLARPTIYSTDYFQRKYEASARANLQRSVEQLEDPSWTEPARDRQNQAHQ